MAWQEILDKGGPVVLILIGYSLLALTIVVERLLYFILLPKPGRQFEPQVRLALTAGNAGRIGEEHRSPEATVARGMITATASGVKDISQVASRLGSEQLQGMERGFRTLGILGNTAPLLGLFGTIIGMIKAFQVIEQAGGKVDAQALAGGIWEAMITTGVGLAVAIPILLLLHMLEGLADRRSRSMRYHASLVLEGCHLKRQEDEEEEDEVKHRRGVLSNAF